MILSLLLLSYVGLNIWELPCFLVDLFVASKLRNEISLAILAVDD